TRQRRSMAAYTELEARFRRLGAVEEAIAVLHWDAAAMMPPGGAAARSEQLATLRGIAHQLLTAPEIADLLTAAEGDADNLGLWQRANLREMRRRWRHEAAVPPDLVEALSRARSDSETVWRAARAARAVPDRFATPRRADPDGTDRLRFRTWEARRERSPLLRRHAGRCAADDALRRSRFLESTDGHAARDRPRALQSRPPG